MPRQQMMKLWDKHVSLITLVILVLLGIIFLYFTVYLRIKSESELQIKTPEELKELVEEKISWSRVLKNTDSLVFYKYLKSKYSDNYNQHTVGHIFGEILFEKEGFAGVEVCDEAFFWGCHHGFVSKAVVIKGDEGIDELFAACKQLPENNYQQCIHGIGHGLIGLYGNDRLVESLNMCDKLDGNESCYTGVFMEYNFPTVAKSGVFESQVREIEKNIYSPCDTLNNKYRESCFYELPRYWERIYNSDFKKIGNSCESLLQISDKKSCFRGVGEIASLVVDHDLEETKSLCFLMPTDFGQNICLISAALGFSSVPEKKLEVESFCLLVDSEYKSECPKN